MRVLLILCDLQAGGAEKTALQLVRELHGEGFEFTVISCKPGGVLGDAYRDAGADLVDGASKVRHDPLAPFRVARVIRSRRIEAVVVVDVARNALFHGLLGAALSMRRPLTVNWCKSPVGGLAGFFAPRLRAYHALGMLNAIVCTSKLQRRTLVEGGVPRRGIPLIRNGVDLRRIASARPARLDIPAGRKVIIQVANIAPDKDHAALIEAAGRLAVRRDDFHLLLVGRGTDSARMRQVVDRKRLSGCVTLLGHRDDVPELLRAADVFVLSTKSEAFSVATLEAMAAGLPLVTSDIPAFDEMFAAGREGLKVPPGDSEALAAAIGRLLDDEPMRRDLSESSLRRSRRFDSRIMAGSFARLLRALQRG